MHQNSKMAKLNKTSNKKVNLLSPPPLKSKLALLFIFLSLSFFHCSSLTAPTDNHCTTEDLVERLQENPPSLSDCSALSIRGANMADIRGAGINKQQLLAVWSTNADIGFIPAQLLTAGITIAEMRSNNITLLQIYNGGVSIAEMRSAGIADYLLFNEVCNTPLSSGTAPGPAIRLLSTRLVATNTHVVLEGRANGTIRWRISVSGINSVATFTSANSINSTIMLRSATAVYLGQDQDDNNKHVSTLSIPLADVFTTFMVVNAENSDGRSTGIQLCSGL